MKIQTRRWLTLLAIVVFIVGMVLIFDSLSQGTEKVNYKDFLKEIEEGKVQSVYISEQNRIYVLRNDSSINRKNFPNKADYVLYGPTRAEIHKDVFAKAEVSGLTDIEYDDLTSVSIWTVLLQLVPYIVIGVFIFVMIRQMAKANSQGANFSKSRARVGENVKTRFTDVAGAEEEKEELKEVIEFLKNPAKFSRLGARIPRGVLLVGPPGTGKTLFAKAVAGEAGVPFFAISGSEFVELYVGVGASRVRDVFDQAKKNSPCIIFIDEIDAVGRQRGAGMGGGHDEREQTLNQLLVEMDGFETNSGVIIMAATNRSDILDPALLRPGRFDRQVYVDYPDVRGREAILKVHARNKPLASDVDFKAIARITAGFTGADLENLLNESAILAARQNHPYITNADVNEGLLKVSMGPAKKSKLITEKEKRETAYHEAGHAIVAAAMKEADKVHEVTIMPRGRALGYVLQRPGEDRNARNRNEMVADIAVAMGGRAAEELVLGKLTTGASQDIKSATSTAHDMVTVYGMSEVLGPVYYGSDREVFLGRGYQSSHDFSEKMAGVIDEETNKIIFAALAEAKRIIQEKMDIMHNMVRVLLEVETIHSEEVDMLMAGKSPAEVVEFVKESLKKHEKHEADLRAAQQSRPEIVVPQSIKREPFVQKPEEKKAEPQAAKEEPKPAKEDSKEPKAESEGVKKEPKEESKEKKAEGEEKSKKDDDKDDQNKWLY